MFLLWNVTIFCVVVGLRQVLGNALFPVDFPIEKTDEIALDKWRTLDKNIRDVVDSVIKQILPIVLKSSVEVNLTSDCSTTLLRMAIGLKQLKEWPLKMFDATGKVQPGIISANMGDFGHYDQCLDISNIDEYTKEVTLQGQYCIVELRPPLPPKPSRIRLTERVPALKNITSDNYVIQFLKENAQQFYSAGLTYGICVPSNCKKIDIENILSYVTSKIGVYSRVHTCEVKQPIKIDTLQCCLIGIFGLLLLLCFFGTAVDYLPYFRNEISQKENSREGIFRQLVTSFSIEKTVQHLLHIEENDLQCIHGIRFFSMAWIVLSFTYIFHRLTKMKNAAIADKYITTTSFQVIGNGTIGMETFFCIGGLVTSYLLINGTENKMKFSKYIPMIIARRLWRLVPSILMVIVLAIVVPLLSSGPLWTDLLEPHAEYCRKDWFYNVLFISNYMDHKTACLLHLWYTSMDFQFYLLAVILLAIFHWKTRFGIGVNFFFIMLSIVFTAGITYLKKFDPIVGGAINNVDEMFEHIQGIIWTPTTHLAPYCIGFALGVYLVKCGRRVKLHPVIQVCGWATSTILCLTVIFAPVKWNQGVPFNTAEQVFFSGLHRTAWTLGICWVIYVCATGNGGVVNRVLSWRMFVPLSRLTFQVYLFSPPLIIMYIGNQRDMLYASNVTLIYEFFGHLIVANALAFAAYILYEGPFLLLGKMIFPRLMKGYDIEECQPTTATVCVHFEKHEDKV